MGFCGRVWIGVVALLAFGLAGCSADSAAESESTAESSPSVVESHNGITVVVNAEVYTVDDDAPWADAFAFDADGTIIAIGDEATVLDAAGGDRARQIDARGNLVLPGFQDVHVHVPEAGINRDICFMPPGASLDDYVALAAECADEQAGADWVRAAGASLFDLRFTDESPLDVLDQAIPDRPAIILDDLGHAVWTNSAGLEEAGIGPNDADPRGGVLHRDAQGRLTGLVLEDAQQLVRNAATPDNRTIYRGLLTSLHRLSVNGVTTVSDAGGYWGQNHPAAWQRAEDERALTVRAFNSLYVYPNLGVETQLAEFEQRFNNDPEARVHFDTAKVYVDGILDLGTALLIDPYDVPIDPNYPNGFRYFEPQQLTRYVNELHALGYRVNFHAIGDQAVRDALDAVEAIDDSPQAIAERRHRVTHTYLVDPRDVDRFAEIGVIADFQQSADAVATDYHEYLAEFIGDRAFDLIPTARLLEADASVSLSSDWDAGPLSPLGTIARSLTRDTNAVPDVETAVALTTIDAAYALGHDDVTGSLQVGKKADFVILDQNIFDIDYEQIVDTEVLLTAVGGFVTFESPEFASG